MVRSVALWLPVGQVKLREVRVYFMKIVICSLLICSSASAASYAPLTGPSRPSVTETFADTSYTLTLGFENEGKQENVDVAVDKQTFDTAIVGQPFVPGLPMIVVAKNAKVR